MRVIIANYRYFVAGGPERYMFNFINEAEKRGIECIPFSVDYSRNIDTPYSKYFVSPRGSRENVLYNDIKLTPKSIIKLLQCSIYNFEAERKLRRLIKDVKPDAVYILHEINSLSPSIIRAAKKENVKVVHRISDFFMFCPKLDFLDKEEVCELCMHGHYKNAMQKKCVKNSFFATAVRVVAMRLYKTIKVFDDVDTYITTCEFTKNILIKGGIPEEKIYCVPTFTEVDTVEPCYSSQNYALCLGRLAKQKGFKYAIGALKFLNNIDIRIKITGDLDSSEESQEIIQIIKEYGLEDRVEFVGFKSGKELENLINNAKCIINPAIWYENFPNTIIEAYAHGKPVVASRIGSLEEMVVDEETGFLFEAKNEKALAEKLRILFTVEDVAEKMGVNARKVCEEKYVADVHMRKLIALLSK